MSAPAARDLASSSTPRHEAGWLLGTVLLSLLPKLWLLLRYPAVPVSDFAGVMAFAREVAIHGPAAPGWFWTFFNAGTPTLLGALMAALPMDPEQLARLATMLVMASLPLLPLLMLRGVVPRWVRVVMALAIALQPAQWVFSDVIAQDDWVQWPTVALACLAIRSARGHGAAPLGAALLWWLTAYCRQEMLVVAAPLALLATCDPRGNLRGWLRPMVMLGLVLALGLAGTALQRGTATGRYALTTTHGGASMLGSYVPGAGFGWLAYEPYVATVAPELRDDPEGMRARAGALTWQEIRKRPGFHLLRRLGATASAATGAEGTLTYWSLSAPGAQAPARADAATLLATRVHPWVVAGFVLLHALFAVALLVALRRRDPALLAIAAAIAAKCALHLLFASQSRFFLVVSALEALAVALALETLWRERALRPAAAAALGLGLLALTAVVQALPNWRAWAERVDAALPHSITLHSANAFARCQLTPGKLLSTGTDTVAFQVAASDPAPGEFAELRCTVRRTAPGPMRIAVEDRYAPGGLGGRMRQDVRIDGVLVRQHDIGEEAWSGWWSQPVGDSARIEVRVVAIRPDPGPAWGNAAATGVRLLAPQ